MAIVLVLGDLHAVAVFGIPLAVVAPAPMAVVAFRKSVSGYQRRGRRLRRAQQQLVGLPDLKYYAALVRMRDRRAVVAVTVVFLVVTGAAQLMALRQQRLCRLRQLGVEQFVDFVVGVEIAPDQSRRPAGRNAAEEQDQQAAAQREPMGVDHGLAMV